MSTRFIRRTIGATAVAAAALTVAAVPVGARDTVPFRLPTGPTQPIGTVSAAAASVTVAASNTWADAAFDTPAGAGDITGAGAADEDGTIVLAVVVRTHVDPYLGWTSDDGIGVEFETNGDGVPDFVLVAAGDDTTTDLYGGVYTTGDVETCSGEQLGFLDDAANSGYGIAVPAGCIGSPATFRARVHLFYAGFEDVAPDTTWGPLVVATTTTPSPAPAPAPAPAPVPRDPAGPVTGYWMVDRDGTVYAFGAARHLGDARTLAPTADLEPTPSGNGYWIVATDGTLAAFGDARSVGTIDPSVLRPGEVVSSMSATLTGNGYWLFTSLGRVFAFGDAAHYGDMSSAVLNGPIVGSTVTPSGHGYWMVGADGGIFTFGDAQFSGSTGNLRLNQPIVGLAADLDGTGYRLVAADGGIFAFDASFRGSMGGTPLNRPVIGSVAFGDGYLMVGADGGIFAFAQEPFFGSLGDTPPPAPIVAVAVR